MRLLRHGGIYRSDGLFHLVNPEPGPACRAGRYQAIGHAGKHMPCPSSAMSSGRRFLDRVARQQWNTRRIRLDKKARNWA
jgi:hypothetical protein